MKTTQKLEGNKLNCTKNTTDNFLIDLTVSIDGLNHVVRDDVKYQIEKILKEHLRWGSGHQFSVIGITRIEQERIKQPREPKHYPKPEYCLCNKGHSLVEVFNEQRNAYNWDCPICIASMREQKAVESFNDRWASKTSKEVV